jgi:protein-tyrosine phosphatase
MLDSLPRHLAFEGATNFRDLGGYPGEGGRPVRWRQLFRSNHLGILTEADIAAIRALKIKSAFDLRGVQERLPTLCCMDDITVHSLPIEPAIYTALTSHVASGKPLTAPDALSMMRQSYRDYVRHNTDTFRTLMAHLLEDHAPLVIHCTAGKDRTGFACAMILRALGVAEDVVVEDYLLTNTYYRIDAATEKSIPLPADVKAALISVEASFLDAAFDAIREDYGDLDSYIGQGLGLGRNERADLQARYLEPAPR